MTSRTSLSGPWRACAVALVSISLMSVTACNGGGTPPPGSPPADSQSPSASSTPSAAPTPTASYKPADATGKAQNVPVPELPEAAKAETKEGLEAFARYWFELLNYGYETGDFGGSGLRSQSPSCAHAERSRPVISGWNSRTDDGSQAARFRLLSQHNVRKLSRTAVTRLPIQVQQAPFDYSSADGTCMQAAMPQIRRYGNLMLAVYTRMALGTSAASVGSSVLARSVGAFSG